MNVRRLLNFSTHPGEPEMFHDDWNEAAQFLDRWEFDGFEIYPVGDYPCAAIRPDIVAAIHLRFFVILAPIWREDRKRLLEIFGDWETVEHFYGGRVADRGAEWIAAFYARQLDLAEHLGCEYVVFHPAHCELDHVFNWRFPWRVDDTLALSADVVNAATRRSRFSGYILFENLWWPGSFRLDDPREYDALVSRVDHPNCGIALDTGHLLNKNPALNDERQAADYLSDCVDNLGEVAREIRTVHLTKSLSGDYVRESRAWTDPWGEARTFWEKLDVARRHVGRIDQHMAFEESHVGAVVEKIAPQNVVFEFTFRNMAEWEVKIAAQKTALAGTLWNRGE